MPADARFQVIVPRPRPVRAQAAQLHEAVEGHLVRGLLLIVNRHQVFRRLPAPVGGEFALDLLAEAFQRRLARGELALEITKGRRLLRLDERRAFRWFTAAREDAVQRVVILRRHGIELVIVTTRAGEREAHGRLADQVDAVVDDVVLVVPETIAESKETHRRHLAFVFEVEFVGGELAEEKLIVGQVFVERTDDPVAIGPGPEVTHVASVVVATFRLGVLREVQPVTAPAFAIARRGEQAVDDLLEGVRRRVVEELIHFLFARRQAVEIERGAAEQGDLVGAGRGREVFGGELFEDEGVDGIFDFRFRISDFRHRRFHDRLIRPMLPGLLHVGGVHRLGAGGFEARIGRAHADPLHEVGDEIVGKLLVARRHREVAVGVADGFDEEAFVRLAGDDGGAGVAALEPAVARVEREAAFDLLRARAVALVTILDQDRTHLGLEEVGLRGGELRRFGSGGSSKAQGPKS